MCQSLWGLCCLFALYWVTAPQLGGSHIQETRCLLPPFFLLQAPYSVPLSIEWGFSASPPPVKLGASTTYYCSPPFRASLEAHLWESKFLQLFVLVRADSSPSWSQVNCGPRINFPLCSRCQPLTLSSSTCSIKILLQLSLYCCIPSLALQWPEFLGSLCC